MFLANMHTVSIILQMMHAQSDRLRPHCNMGTHRASRMSSVEAETFDDKGKHGSLIEPIRAMSLTLNFIFPYGSDLRTVGCQGRYTAPAMSRARSLSVQ